jgi:hypothetical protein
MRDRSGNPQPNVDPEPDGDGDAEPIADTQPDVNGDRDFIAYAGAELDGDGNAERIADPDPDPDGCPDCNVVPDRHHARHAVGPRRERIPALLQQ